MGAEVRLRCWARHGDSGHLCDKTPKHSDRHRGCDARVERFWNDSECAHNANSAGRETAALRILEVSHEADRLLFTSNITIREWPEFLRAVAARLYANTSAARADLLTLLGEIGQGERLVEGCATGERTDTFTREMVGLLKVASDLIRPFAGVA